MALLLDLADHGPDSECEQYVRYIQWFITFPLLLLSVLLSTGLSLSDITTTLFMGMFMVICGLVGALVQSTYKWGFYVFGCVALFHIWFVFPFPTLPFRN